MTSQEMEFQLLLKELDHADTQIGAYLDLQVKILGLVLTVVGGCLGLMLASKPGEPNLASDDLAKLLAVIAAVGSLGVLQSAITYGIALGYMHSKVKFIAPRLQRLLELREAPLQAIRAFRDSPSSPPVLLATVVLAVGTVTLEIALLWAAWQMAEPGSLTRWFVRGSFVLLAAVVACQVLIGGAMRRIGRAGV